VTEVATKPVPTSVASDDGRAADQRRARTELMLQRGGFALVLLTAFAALIVHSGFFHRADWLAADHMYHRGVAYNVQGGRILGEDYFAGHVSYFAGTWHLVFGRASQVLGTSYDTLVIAASWVWGPIWVGVLALFGYRLFRGDWVRTSLFVLLGTFAAQWSTAIGRLWVDGVLPSGVAEWPLYPRDVALAAAVLAAWAALSPRRWVRVGVSALFAALALTTHSQIGVLAVIVAPLTVLVGPESGRARRERARETVASIAVLTAVSAWWWLPQGRALLSGPDVELKSWPGLPPVVIGPVDFFIDFGMVGVLSIAGALLLARARAWRDRRVVLAIWLGIVAPLIPIARLTGDAGFFTERRLWLLAAPALVALAAEAAAALVRAAARAQLVLAAVVAGALVLPGVPALIATQDLISTLWYAPVRSNGLQFNEAEWSPVWDQLNHQVREHGSYQIAAPEEYGASLWAYSGAQVVSLWLPGPYKLGYDPKPLTGFGYEERVHRQAEAFGRGVPGLCGLARPFELDAFVLDRLAGDRIGTFDVWPAAQYRRDRIDRNTSDLNRVVAPGLRYRDEGAKDVLALEPGAGFTTSWSPGAVDVARVSFQNRKQKPARVEISSGDTTKVFTVPPVARIDTIFQDRAYRALGPITVRAVDRVDLMRVEGFEPVPSLAGPDGPFIVTPGRLCPSG
jgi:hypothetical protein